MSTTRRRASHIRGDIEELREQYDADSKALDACSAAERPGIEAKLKAMASQIGTLMADFKEAKAREERGDAERHRLQDIFSGGKSRTVVSDGDRTGKRYAGGGLAKAIFDKGWDLHSQPRIEFNFKSTLPSAETYSPRPTGGPIEMGRDERWLWPWLPSQDVGDDTAISDFVQSGSRTVTGTVLRALDASSDKAELDVTLELVTAEIQQLAIVLEDIPNALLESMNNAAAFFGGELRYQIFAALDAHVVAQIAAATPPSGLTGAEIITQVRNAVAAMRLVGRDPNVLALNPTDSAAFDLLQDNNADFMFVNPQSPSATRSLWGMQVVEHAMTGGADPPLLVDTSAIGLLYLGSIRLEADPYSNFKKNLTNLRCEVSALFHVRAADAAYIVETP